MADDKSKAGTADRKRININQDYEVQDWSKSLGVTPEQQGSPGGRADGRRRSKASRQERRQLTQI